MSAPVGDSRADDRPWRVGPLVRAVRDRAATTRPSDLVPRTMRAFPYTAPTRPKGLAPLREDSTLGIDYDSDWARTPVAKATRRILQETVLRTGIEVLASPTVLGTDRLDRLKGPVIFAANHHSHVDTGLLLMSLPRRFRERAVVAAGADYFFDKRSKAIVSALMLHAFPIERKKVSRQSSDQLLELLHDGWNLVIFPEGGRSPDGWGQEFKPGAAFLALRRGCPVVPVHLDGTGEVLPKGKSRPRRHPCTVMFGTPLRAHDREDARRFSARVERAIVELADESTTDWWTARRNAAADTTPTLTAPAQVRGWRREWQRTAGRHGAAKPDTADRAWPPTGRR